MKIGRGGSEDLWEPPTQKDFDDFRSGILPLAEAGKLGVLLLQYPAGFHCSPENLEKVQDTLRRFYDYPKAVELRHRSWNENSVEVEPLLLQNRASGFSLTNPNSRLQSARN